MPCQEIFLQQPIEYQKDALPGDIPTLSVEASSVHGWHRFAHQSISMTTYGLSAPCDALLEHFVFSTANVIDVALSLLHFYKSRPVPNLRDRPDSGSKGLDNGLHH
jgi:transketolase